MGKIEIGGMGKVRALSLVWGLPIPVDKVEVEEDDDEEEMDVEMSAETKGKGKGTSLSSYRMRKSSLLIGRLDGQLLKHQLIRPLVNHTFWQDYRIQPFADSTHPSLYLQRLLTDLRYE